MTVTVENLLRTKQGLRTPVNHVGGTLSMVGISIWDNTDLLELAKQQQQLGRRFLPTLSTATPLDPQEELTASMCR